MDLCSSPDLLHRVQQLRPLANDHRLTLAQLAIAWTLSNPNIGATIIGASNTQQIRESAAAQHTLSEPTMSEIDRILGDLIERDPDKTLNQYATMPSWRRPPDPNRRPSRSATRSPAG